MTAQLAGRAAGAARAVWRRVAPAAVILMYHRVADVDLDPWGLCVSPQHFDEQMAVLRRLARPMPLAKLVRELGEGRVPRRAAAVTFDDGYADNLLAAHPVLARHGVPATVFMTSGALGAERDLWWDELAELLLGPGALPATLELTVCGARRRWDLGGAARYTPEQRRIDRRLRAWEAAPGTRHALYYQVWGLLQPLPHAEQRLLLDQLWAWAGAAPPARANRTLLPAEAGALVADGLVEAGAHTASHPQLSAHAAAAQRREIACGREQVESIVGRPVRSFAYPYGDYTAETAAIVRELGFGCACTTSGRAVRRGADRFQLPRFEVLDWDGHSFERELRVWLRS